MSDTTARRPSVRDDVALMAGYHSPQLDVAVRLNTNEAPGSPPEAFSEALVAAVRKIDWNRYPDRSAKDLREAIASLEGFDAAQVFAANGSNEVLQSLCLAYGGSGRTALTFEPTYALHSHIARVCGTNVVEFDRDAGFRLDPAAAAAAVREVRPHLVFLCSPNNPTGMLEDRETVEAVLTAAGEVGALLIVDEAYGQFAPWSALRLLDEDLPLVVTRTYSKTWSMAGARLGYMIGPTWVVQALESVALPYHLDAVTQLAGVLALDHRDAMEQRVATLVEERGRVSAALGRLDVDQWPSAANFILFRPRGIDGRQVWAELVERGVLVRDCSSWPRLEGCLRVTLGTRDEDDVFLTALGDVLAAGAPR